jgi:AraC family carnitine catabolism transcriptional activator
MLAAQDKDTPERIGFLLVPQFSMLGFLAAVEPLRVANRLSRRRLYEWQVISEDGQAVAASNGMAIVAEAAIAAVPAFSTVIVCASFDPEAAASKPLLAWLRRLDRQGSVLGALETGVYLLAQAGLVARSRVTLHWENLPGFQERFPEIQVTGELYEIDGKRITCAGGTAALDMMLHVIGARHGLDLALAISEQMLHARIRNPDDHQRMALGLRTGVRHPKLLKILEAMEASVEEPLASEALAALGGISRRQLERLFRAHLGDTPTGYYLKLRLSRARHLLEQTEMSVLQVALALPGRIGARSAKTAASSSKPATPRRGGR